MQAPTRRRIRLAAAAVLAGSTALASLVALAALNFGGAARLGPLTLLELEKGYDREVVAALAAPAPDYGRVARLSRKAVTLFPYDTSAWLRLAMAEVARKGRLGPEGVHDLQTSYDLVAYDPYVFDWRVRLALDHWRELPPALRASAIAEARIFAHKGSRERVMGAFSSVQDPAGRLAASILAQELQ